MAQTGGKWKIGHVPRYRPEALELGFIYYIPDTPRLFGAKRYGNQ